MNTVSSVVAMMERVEYGMYGAQKQGKDGVVGESIYSIERQSTKGEKREAGDTPKVFGVCWDRKIGIVSASEDKTLQINRGRV